MDAAHEMQLHRMRVCLIDVLCARTHLPYSSGGIGGTSYEQVAARCEGHAIPFRSITTHTMDARK